MRPSGFIVSLLLVVLYIALFIPLILPALNRIFLDWVNSSEDMFVQNFCVERQVLNTTTNKFDTIVECTRYDFRPLVVFLYQLVVYFALPLTLILMTVRRR